MPFQKKIMGTSCSWQDGGLELEILKVGVLAVLMMNSDNDIFFKGLSIKNISKLHYMEHEVVHS